jgi:hypothetical protein
MSPRPRATPFAVDTPLEASSRPPLAGWARKSERREDAPIALRSNEIRRLSDPFFAGMR